MLSLTWEAKLQPEGSMAERPLALSHGTTASHKKRQCRVMANSMSQELQNPGLKMSSSTYPVTLDDFTRLLVSSSVCRAHDTLCPALLFPRPRRTSLPLDTHIAACPLPSCLCSIFTFTERLFLNFLYKTGTLLRPLALSILLILPYP